MHRHLTERQAIRELQSALLSDNQGHLTTLLKSLREDYPDSLARARMLAAAEAGTPRHALLRPIIDRQIAADDPGLRGHAPIRRISLDVGEPRHPAFAVLSRT